jgi:peptidoglycan/xylan/chitin deacetylase (PgdA/CDA1 family)
VLFIYRIEQVIAYLFYYTGVYWLRKRFLDRAGAAVVLVYHRVLGGRRGVGEFVGEHSFEDQMRFLKAHAHTVQWEEVVFPTGPQPRMTVLVTFDDGYRDNFTRALPVLERYQIPAVFFAVTKFVFERKAIDDEGEAETDIFPSTDELDKARGSRFITFGNHTASHRIVSRMSLGELKEELNASQKTFDEKLKTVPEVFAFPRGRQQDIREGVVPVLQRAGIKAAFTMVPGLVGPRTHRYFVPRIGVSHVNDDILFKVKMVGLLNPLVRLKNVLGL